MNGSIAGELADARARTLALVEDLDDAVLMPPLMEIVNPVLWEIGHIAWFQEKWCLRHLAGRDPLVANGDALFDSAAVEHDTRWGLPMLTRDEILAYTARVLAEVTERLEQRDLAPEERWFHQLALFHEDMHGEALAYTRQTLELPPPAFAPEPEAGEGALPGDAEFSSGTFRLGATGDEPFVFDNEKWAHEVEVTPFRLARAAVTQGEFAAFVEDRGYARRELWSDAGWRWREETGAEHPVYWRPAGGSWERRHYDCWRPLEADRAILHVAWYEAEAFCNWAGRRLPTEAEWEFAASATKARFPWGDDPETEGRAHVGLTADGCREVGALAAGDSAEGCRQMIGNVWEWTSTTFGPYPGFTPDPYKEYSAPWFGDHMVLRGGCFATRPRLLRNTWRNFYRPYRRDVFAGFRTAADAI